MAKSYVVTGPLATPYTEEGTRAYFYEGVEWPAGGLREGETERFLELGLIAESGSESEEPKKAPAKKAAAKPSDDK